TQKQYYALNLNASSYHVSTDDAVNLVRHKIDDALNDPTFRHVASVYDYQSDVVRDGLNYEGKKIITFAGILQHETFPLAEIVKELLEIGEAEMNLPIEIEFAVDMDVPKGNPYVFNFLQIRPIVESDQSSDIDMDVVKPEETILWSQAALGNGEFFGLRDLVYVKPDAFNAAASKEIASIMEKLNDGFRVNKTGYVLVGPGRWGSSDPWLGIPVKWSQISAVRIIVESGLENFRIDPSQGTHFFQNLTSFRVGYMTINPFLGDGSYDTAFLDQMEAVYEDAYVRHVRFDTPLEILIDGKTHRGAVMKPKLY
ncbi:MAG: phosphoenolpyruvate synthase, partial [Bacteroidota bacterium]|nr:phosphoenolpyruvate synthase [Bacteroidota bacterium]